MQRKKALLQSHQKKMKKKHYVRRPSALTRISANGTMSQYSQTPLISLAGGENPNIKFTPLRASENTLENVFWKKNS